MCGWKGGKPATVIKPVMVGQYQPQLFGDKCPDDHLVGAAISSRHRVLGLALARDGHLPVLP